jgi:hypothetical protein
MYPLSTAGSTSSVVKNPKGTKDDTGAAEPTYGGNIQM